MKVTRAVPRCPPTPISLVRAAAICRRLRFVSSPSHHTNVTQVAPMLPPPTHMFLISSAAIVDRMCGGGSFAMVPRHGAMPVKFLPAAMNCPRHGAMPVYSPRCRPHSAAAVSAEAIRIRRRPRPHAGRSDHRKHLRPDFEHTKAMPKSAWRVDILPPAEPKIWAPANGCGNGSQIRGPRFGP